jgi:hypothetical protein
MSRQHPTLASLRPTAADFAAAAALYGPSLLLQLQAAQPRDDQPPTRRSPRTSGGSSVCDP